MKIYYIYFLVFILSICDIAHAQQKDSSTIYYDKGWRILVDNSEDVAFIRKAIKKDGIWYVNDYFKEGYKLQMSGAYKDYLDSLKEGVFKYYFRNGQLSEEGKYVAGARDGIWKNWHENGDISSITNYSQGYIVGKKEGWWDNGNKYCEVQYIDDVNKIKSYEKKDSAGNIIKRLGVLIGTCKYYFKNGVMSSKETWENDSLIALEIWNENGVSETPTRDKDGRLTIEVMAEFKNGIKGLQLFLNSNIKYPRKARSKNQQGKVISRFVVNIKGDIEQVYILKTSGYPLLDEEALRVINLMNGHWIPGKQHNQPVRVFYTLPTTFRLED